MIAILVALAAASSPGCGDHWIIEFDRESFAHNGAGRAFSAASLAAFRSKVGAQLKIAAADACASRNVTRSRAAAIRQVRVVSASGATEPHFYSGGKARLNFEWVFAEEGLAIPPRADLVGALVCWAKPTEPACASEGD